MNEPNTREIWKTQNKIYNKLICIIYHYGVGCSEKQT